jgi:sulfate adenylyltransferase subunit 1
MDILRFITAGSIDDGKSTLIGRLLLDTKNIKSDILDAISGKGTMGNEVNLAFITDGLRAEREAGITIDVAYKYFTTPQRKFIITDAPGHFHYTKNLVTGASGVDAIIILIDAVNGISEQTRRHSLVASFLQIDNIVVAINKMDLVGFDKSVYNSIKQDYLKIAEQLKLRSVSFIPICALNGDNIISHSSKMAWYTQGTLLEYLENCKPKKQNSIIGIRLPIQYSSGDYHYGRLLSGTIKKEDTLLINAGEQQVIVDKIISNYKEVNQAFAGMDICFSVKDRTTINRGDLLSDIDLTPACTNEFEAAICWLDDTLPLTVNKEYLLRINARETTCYISKVISKTLNATFDKQFEQDHVSVNEMATVIIKTVDSVTYDSFAKIQETGRAIIIDIETNNTSGAVIIH